MYLLCYTFYDENEQLVGLDAHPLINPVPPVALFAELVDAPITSVMAVVSLVDMETDEFLWISVYGMVAVNGEEN